MFVIALVWWFLVKFCIVVLSVVRFSVRVLFLLCIREFIYGRSYIGAGSVERFLYIVFI